MFKQVAFFEDRQCSTMFDRNQISLKVFHFHYDHLNFIGFKAIQQKSVVTGLPEIFVPS